MAKLRGAMHSDEAAGKFGGSMIFRRGKNGPVVTGYYKPGSAKPFTLSPAQIAQREKYGQAVQAWRALTIEEKAVFNENAKAQNISGWNLYFKNYGGTPPPPPPSYPEFTYNGHTYQLAPEITGLEYSIEYVNTGAQSDTDGAGNTTALIALGAEKYPAAKACADYTDGTYSDWFLPAKDESWAAYQALGSGGFPSYYYWSSTEVSVSPGGYAWFLLILYGGMVDGSKGSQFSVRPVRIKN